MLSAFATIIIVAFLKIKEMERKHQKKSPTT
jgi:hypothetical protein